MTDSWNGQWLDALEDYINLYLNPYCTLLFSWEYQQYLYANGAWRIFNATMVFYPLLKKAGISGFASFWIIFFCAPGANLRELLLGRPLPALMGAQLALPLTLLAWLLISSSFGQYLSGFKVVRGTLITFSSYAKILSVYKAIDVAVTMVNRFDGLPIFVTAFVQAAGFHITLLVIKRCVGEPLVESDYSFRAFPMRSSLVTAVLMSLFRGHYRYFVGTCLLIYYAANGWARVLFSSTHAVEAKSSQNYKTLPKKQKNKKD